MSWIDQCANAFKQQATVMHWHDKLDKKIIINKLSLESGIPKIVLWKWWKQNGNKNRAQHTENCIKCGLRPIYIKEDCINSLSKKSKYFGLCSTCRRKKYKKDKEEKKNDKT